MPTGRGDSLGGLPAYVRRLLDEGRRGVMTTLDPYGSAHSVPVVFAVVDDEIVSPIDHKPKTGQVLARVKNLRRDPRATLLVDHWDEDWTKLVWLMIRGTAHVDEEPPIDLMRAINARYPPYAADERHDAIIRLRPTRLTWWSWS
jgi:PPOX class probable F420-dependent enzyme